MLRVATLIFVIKVLVQLSKIFESSYNVSFDRACTSSTCKNLMSCGFLQGAPAATYRRYVRVTRLVHRYSEAVQLVEKVNDEVAAGNSASRNGELGVRHLDSALVLVSKKRVALFLVQAALLPQQKK